MSVNGYGLLHELARAEEAAAHLNAKWARAAEEVMALDSQFNAARHRLNELRDRVAALIDSGLRSETSAEAAIAEQAVIDSFVGKADSASLAPIEQPPADTRVTGFSCPNCGDWRPLSDLAEDGVCRSCWYGESQEYEDNDSNHAPPAPPATPAPASIDDAPRREPEPSADSWADEACVGEHLPGRAAVAAIRPPSRDELAQRAVDHVAAAGVLGYSELLGYLTASMTELPDDDARRRAVDAVHIARRRGVLWYDDDGCDVSSRSAMLDAQLIRLMRAQASGIPQAVLLGDTRRALASLTPPIVIDLSEAATALKRLVATGRLAQRGLTVSAPKPRVATLGDEQREGLRTMLRGGRSINSIAKATGLGWAAVNEFALAEGFKRA